MPLPPLPVDAILPDLLEALAVEGACVVHAPPGSGKTTRIPLALLDAPWLGPHKILMLEPRRLAARAAARHMAGLLGEKAGGRIGYRTRLDQRVSRQTRVEVVTEGILTRMLQHDPELSSYGCVIFDEFHARSLQADLGLALCLDVRGALRPDLRLMVMSATLDVEAVAGLIVPCRVLSCPGQPHPVDTRYLRPPGAFVEERMAKAIRHLLATEPGSILAFLPGAREIQRTHELLDNPGPGVSVHPLLGALTATEQDRAIAPAAPGTRKIVLATAIAETSLTIDGVRIVIDSGLARLPRFDPVSGMTRLVTEPASLATLIQRRGRAGRTEPGVCIRIWDQADEISRKPFPLPEILEADLAPLVLDLALWGVTDPARLTWPTPPPTGNYSSAVQLLQRLLLVDEQGRVTAHGRDVAVLPLHPRLGHMVLTAAKQGLGPTAAHLAALLAEPGRVMRAGPDLRDALSSRARIPEPVRQGMDQIRRLASIPAGPDKPEAAGLLTALAYPDRIARRQEDGSYRLTSGRKALWPGPSTLAKEEFLAIADLDGEAAGARIWQAAPIEREELERWFGEEMREVDEVRFDPIRDRVTATRKRMLGALCVREEVLNADQDAITRALLAGMPDLSWLPWNQDSRSLRDRVRFLRGLDPDMWPDLGDEALRLTVQDWLKPFVQGARSRADLAKAPLTQALKNLVSWNRLAELDRLAPEHMAVPSGAARRIDYSPESGPILPVKLQEMFGCATTPTLANNRHPLVLHLLSPAGRPLQVTRDLESFWKNGYPLVRAEMRGRYPKHPWPEDPTSAPPTAKTKKAMTPR
jgi:ATP-dependent helicase HrpB